MRFSRIKIIAGCAVVAASISLSGAASATQTVPATSAYTVSGGGTNGALTVANVGNMVFTNSGGSPITCTGLAGPGTASVGNSHLFTSTVPPNSWAFSMSVRISGCTSVIGAMTFSYAGGGDWLFGVGSKTAGTATGYLAPVQLSVTSAVCSYDLKGYVSGTYSNSTGNVVTSSRAGLTIFYATGSGCSLIYAIDGHLASLTGTIHLAGYPATSPTVTIS